MTIEYLIIKFNIMRSIKARVNYLRKENPDWGSIVCFMEAVRGQNFSKDMIGRWFHKLIEQNDYSNKEKKDILKNIYKINKEIFKPKERHNFIPKYYSK